jgi:hypothetical protein
MAGTKLVCGKCAGTNTIAKYQHAHVTPYTWEKPAWGPTPTGLPFPDPCPTDGVSCQAIQVRCANPGCGWVKNIPLA